MASVSSLDAPVYERLMRKSAAFWHLSRQETWKRIVWNVWKQKACKLSSGGAWMSCQGKGGSSEKIPRWGDTGGNRAADWAHNGTGEAGTQ